MSLKNPQKQFRALPFWSWNGKLEEKELKRQAEILEEMGFGGAFLHSRCGLQTEYMSEEWLALIEKTADYFDGKGMQGWLYDEDRWPSGSCGGLATEKMENRQKALSMYLGNDGTMYEDKQVLGTFAIQLIGEADKGKTHFGKRLLRYVPLAENEAIPCGYEKAVFVVEFIEPSDFYNGNTYLDTLNPSAVQDFLALTHEKYKSAFGEKFGGQVKGIFVDEPHRGGVFNGFNITNANAQAMLPWSYAIFDLYAEKFGERVEEKLPELFFAPSGEAFNRTAWRYLEVLQTQFLKSFAKPYYEWCNQNRLLVTGHVWEENTLLGQVHWQGSVMRYYEYMDIPGIDNLRDGNYFFAAPLQAISVAKQTGKREVLSEMYACTGWKTTFDDYKRSGDWQAVLGINVRCPHLSWYTMGGEAKRDCPASVFFQAGWYREYRYVEDYFARLAMTFGQAESLTDTLLLSPIESAWGLVRAGAYGATEAFKKLDSDWRTIIDELLFGGVDFDVADEDILARKARIAVENGAPFLAVGRMKYQTVVLPPLIHLRGSTLYLLKAFAFHGGRIVVADALPTYVDGVRAQVDITATVEPMSSILDAVNRARVSRYSIAFEGKMLSKLKRNGKETLLYAVAFDCETCAEARIEIDGVHMIAAIDLRNGERQAVAYRIENGKTIVEKTFSKGEEQLLSIDGEAAELKTEKPRHEIFLPTTELSYALNEPNVLPLDVAQYWIDGVEQGRDEVLKIDGKIRAQFGYKERSANNKQPWFEEKYHGEEYRKKLCRIRLQYTFNADVVPSNCCLTLEELPNATWRFNGRQIKKSSKKPWIEDVCFTRYEIPSEQCKIGKNYVEVEFDFTPACNLETVYFVGEFAVDEGSRTLRALPKRVRFGDLCKQGFPFYTGAFTYRLPVENGVYDIEELRFVAACVTSNGRIAAFAPFGMKGIEVTDGELPLTVPLLRRNLFGPLHEIPKNHGNYWSGSFRTVGERFTSEYQINEQGILATPKIYVRSEENE